ncbi:histone-lysine N-methyltransferase, H3 lysine-79 specific-like isoform X2 [Mercenaria mercenaria]|uniref:histone-lysine N-methyltransferase, H3 lysine-79 specific-like isoform X2 n=1 Tax=Mercenaria mercenaria TaxID=6596 RepID=UPI00234F8AF2|nr:histone-lysine N-methyltransferase, H3 lysine-79 specific-like isoform X2 [Mercenaria mercenaria]
MQFYGSLALLLALVIQVRGIPRITLDDDAPALCKKYKMMCKTDKICAVQHFDWPNNITIPVCIPLSFVPVRKMICQLPPDTGRCHARYIRWYYNIHAQECSHFQYGGCEGNGNNFMSKKDCEQTCIATPSIRLYEGGGNSALAQPSIITAPIYEPPKTKKYEALNSVMEPTDNLNRYELVRHRTNRIRADEAITRTRRRLDKEKEKERKRRERRKLKKRKRRCKKRRERGKKCRKDKKDRKSRKNKKKKKTDSTEDKNDISSDKNNVVTEDTNQVVEETKNIISNEIEAVDEDEKLEKETKRERKRRKRKLKEKRRLEKERNRRNLSSRHQKRYSELAKRPESYSRKLFSILDQGKSFSQQKNSLLHTLS